VKTQNCTAGTHTASRLVTAGTHELMVEYYEHTEGAVARLAISPERFWTRTRRIRVGSADVRM
jgi:hypothetical protein